MPKPSTSDRWQRRRYLLSSIVLDGAEPRPQAIAVTCGDQQLTWAELEQRSAQLAEVLLGVGIKPGDRIGIYLHKSVESMVAIHGITRAGAAYVPIDPLAPAATVAGIVDDCGIDVLVSHEARRRGIEQLSATRPLRAVVGLDAPVAPSAGQGSPEATPHADPAVVSWSEVATADRGPVVPVLEDDLAYVMYTSGSTGKPKGLIHTHRSAMSYVHNAVELYDLHDGDRMANFAPMHFDMSTFEFLAGPQVGAEVILIPEPHLRFPATLTEHLERQRPTILQTVPSLYQQLLARGGVDQRDFSAVRWVIAGGEVFPPAALKQWAALCPQARFSNTYGPAEVNQCSYWHFDAADITDEPIPIGYPVPNTELLVVDDNDQPVPEGQQGMLLARTANMMQGYWNRPDLDEQAFLYRTAAGGRIEKWYRIGDVVSRHDGVLRFYGRRDNQIKIRGNRVELEGVEAAVASMDGVEQAIVGRRAGPDGDDILVARYIPDGDQSDPTRWRQLLSEMLPAYAVPSAFEVAEKFPTTPSGKADRRAVRDQIAET
jgi:amino acid adenylation domain-containing protein